MMHWWGGCGLGMGFGWLFMILFWALVIIGIIYLVKFIATASKKEEKGETALDMLKKRYVKGEISKEEFEEKKKEIQ